MQAPLSRDFRHVLVAVLFCSLGMQSVSSRKETLMQQIYRYNLRPNKTEAYREWLKKNDQAS